MIRRLAVLSLIAFSFTSFGAPEKREGESDEAHAARIAEEAAKEAKARAEATSPAAESRKPAEIEKIDQADFLKATYIIPDEFAEGYRKNIDGDSENLAGMEVAELTLSGPLGETETQNAERLKYISTQIADVIDKITNSKELDDVEKKKKKEFYVRLKWGVDYELGGKVWGQNATPEFKKGYEKGREEKIAATKALKETNELAKKENANTDEISKAYENLKTKHRITDNVFVGHAAALEKHPHYLKNGVKGENVAAFQAAALASVKPDGEGRRWVTGLSADRKPTSWYIGKRTDDPMNASAKNFIAKLADKEPPVINGAPQTPWKDTKRFADLGGAQPLVIENEGDLAKTPERFAKAPFQAPPANAPAGNGQAAVSFASTPKAADIPQLVAALKNHQGACFDCHGKTTKVKLSFEGSTPADFKVTGNGTTYGLADLADAIPNMGNSKTSHAKLPDLIRAWSKAQ